jgi:hypothetical protein
MHSSAATLAREPVALSGAKARWISSPVFDCSLLLLSPLLGLAVLGAELDLPGGFLVVVVTAYFLGIPHYLSTFTFFLDDKNLAYYWSRRALFVGGPVLIFLGVFGMQYFRQAIYLQAAVFLWNLYHVALQSAGVCSVYRHLNGGLQAEKRPAHATILFAGLAMGLWHAQDYFPVAWFLPATVHGLLAPAFAIGAAVAFLLWLAAVSRRNAKLASPEVLALASGVLLFHPYLWVRDTNLATLGVLIGHFLQYLALVWLVHSRRHARPEGSWHQRWLGAVSRSRWRILAFVLTTGIVAYAAESAAARMGLTAVYASLFYVLVFSHFYLDGLIWAFKQPHVRANIGPYLAGPPRL